MLQTKRCSSSYGPALTPYEQLQLARLESDLDDKRLGRGSHRPDDVDAEVPTITH
jgi:hypothetical protein